MGIVLFSRPNCPLCDEARSALENEKVAFEEVDITLNSQLRSAHGKFVPVVEVDGSEVFTGGMDPSDLPSLVRASN